jgi:hypothetical protein
MPAKFSEEEVHEFIHNAGLESLIIDCPEIDNVDDDEAVEEDFFLWKIIKKKALSKIAQVHDSVRYGSFIASKLKLPTDKTTPMELDFLGTHEDGLFILELKVNKPAERNAFSELFAYSNYIADTFSGSGRKDVANILVAPLDAKITRQAFLYDLLITDRDIVVYRPEFSGEELNTLQLRLHLPSDEDFKAFTNNLLAHENMSCVVASFDDLEGWFDSDENNGSLNDWTKKHLGMLSNYTAQRMEAEGLHGFCFVRKPWKEISLYYRNSLIICAVNPFRLSSPVHATAITEQLSEDDKSTFFEFPMLGFEGRLIRIARRAVRECFKHNHSCEVELPLWEELINSPQETVFTHNFAFRPTGMLREAYVSHLDGIYARNEADIEYQEDVSMLKINEINNWFRAWEFMRSCGFDEEEDASE